MLLYSDNNLENLHQMPIGLFKHNLHQLSTGLVKYNQHYLCTGLSSPIYTCLPWDLCNTIYTRCLQDYLVPSTLVYHRISLDLFTTGLVQLNPHQLSVGLSSTIFTCLQQDQSSTIHTSYLQDYLVPSTLVYHRISLDLFTTDLVQHNLLQMSKGLV